MQVTSKPLIKTGLSYQDRELNTKRIQELIKDIYQSVLIIRLDYFGKGFSQTEHENITGCLSNGSLYDLDLVSLSSAGKTNDFEIKQ